MRGTDFKHWFNWVKRNKPNPPSYDEAFRIYYEHYTCNCQSCAYRKEHGFIPLPTHRADCTCPDGQPKLPERVA